MEQMGPPRVSDPRTKTLMSAVTQTEYDLFRAYAAAIETTVSNLLRLLIVNSLAEIEDIPETEWQN